MKDVDKKNRYILDFSLAFVMFFLGGGVLLEIIIIVAYFGVDPIELLEPPIGTAIIIGAIFFVAGIIDIDVIGLKRKMGYYKNVL